MTISACRTIHIPVLPPNKKVFFASDFHLGTPGYLATKDREKKLVDWLDGIQPEAHALFLLGDIFDFWFEYKHTIPKGLVRLQGKLAAFTDAGIPVYLVPGNHDCWIRDYFLKELNLQVLEDSVQLYIHGRKFLVGHGDELGGTRSYRLLKKYVYKSSILNWIFRNFPPGVSFSIGTSLSKIARKKHSLAHSLPPAEDFILKFCKEIVEPSEHHDYYVFGHLHFPYSKSINDSSVYFNIGDWINYFSYGIFDGTKFWLAKAE